MSFRNLVCLLPILVSLCDAFTPQRSLVKPTSRFAMAETSEDAAAPLVSGEELEVMLTEFDQPLVVDAYATWYVDKRKNSSGEQVPVPPVAMYPGFPDAPVR